MAEAQAKHHDYHLVDPSPWPIVGAVSAFIMAVGAIVGAAGADHRGTVRFQRRRRLALEIRA